MLHANGTLPQSSDSPFNWSRLANVRLLPLQTSVVSTVPFVIVGGVNYQFLHPLQSISPPPIYRNSKYFLSLPIIMNPISLIESTWKKKYFVLAEGF